MRRIIMSVAATTLLLVTAPAIAPAETMHGIAMHGEPALPAGFDHFPYANPNAPKGGRINYALQGTFDSVNPFIVQGAGVRGLFDPDIGNTVFETLMARSRDEAFTLYPLLAESVETDDERSFVEYTLNPLAKFSDGTPVTSDDVIFSFELFREKARPLYQNWLKAVAKMEKVGERGVRLTFNDRADRETPLLLSLLPILPKHATDAERFDKSTLKPMIGSGAYVIDSVKAGDVVILKRNPDYWGKNLPSRRGFDNFDEIRINYFRDENTMFEAFKKGLVDVQIETDTARWTSGYNFPAATDGRVEKDEFARQTPSGMYGFVMNTRRPVFRNADVRLALAGLFDFEWANKNLFSDAYVRTRSFFDGSELSSSGRIASPDETALLAPFPGSVRPQMLEGSWAPPVSDGTGRDRAFLKAGFDALKAAGYSLKDGIMVDPDGRPLTFEILLRGKGGEGISVAWQRTLEKLGIAVTLRAVDDAQYLARQRNYDFDVMLVTYLSSLSPGAEQIGRWGSSSKDADGTYNFAGVAEPAIDAVIERLVKAESEDDFVTAVRAYDRLLLSGAYVVPLYYQPKQWVAHWKHIKHPETTSIYGFQLPTWWSEAN